MALAGNGQRSRGGCRRPLVGITGGSYDLPIAEGTLPSYGVDRCNPRAVVQAGGDPVLVVAVGEADESAPERYADMLDGFVFAGGVDIAPSTYGEPDPPPGTADHEPVRDRFEIALLHAVRDRGKPILGVCRGMELITVAYGGTLVDGVEHPTEPVPMDGFERMVLHRVTLAPGSLAEEVYGSSEVDVGCLHHQAAGSVPSDLTASGWAPDGVVEAIEGDREGGFLLGLLFHPEYMVSRNPVHLRPYEALIGAAREAGAASTDGMVRP
jgi:putative glutamine amidotransferase